MIMHYLTEDPSFTERVMRGGHTRGRGQFEGYELAMGVAGLVDNREQAFAVVSCIVIWTKISPLLWTF